MVRTASFYDQIFRDENEAESDEPKVESDELKIKLDKLNDDNNRGQKMSQVPLHKNYSYTDYLWCTYLISIGAAWLAEFVTYPLDLTKTRLQIQGEIANNKDLKIGMAPYRGMIRTAFGIATEEGVLKLWKGVHAALVRHVLYSGTRIVMYRSLKEDFFKHKNKNEYFPLWKSAFCGTSAGAFAQFISSPADLMKVQLQMEGKRRLVGLPPRVNGMLDVFQQVVRTSGYKGLWQGAVPNAQRAALVNLGDLTTYDTVKRVILKTTSLPDNHIVHIISSFCAGFVAATVGTPADVIKTRIMNQPLDEHGKPMCYSSVYECFVKTVRNEGIMRIFRGFVPFFYRIFLFNLWYLYWFDAFSTGNAATPTCKQLQGSP